MVGSPKPGRSSSLALGEYLLDELARRGWDSETVNLRRVMSDPDRLRTAAGGCELLILAYPLYVFGLPAPLVLALERLAEAPRDHDGAEAGAAAPRLVGIVNCGFPEHAHNDLSIEMCRLFAAQAGWHWSGALSLGGGGVLNGGPLRERGPVARSVRRALELAAEALDDGRDIPEEAVHLMAKPMVPLRIYRWLTNYGWRRLARSNGVAERLAERPPLAAQTPEP
jgi:hypothetical protein